MSVLRMLLAPGTILPGGYEIVDRIGSGGMGEVLLARVLNRGTRVAVKVLHQRDNAEPERFEREIRAAARIRHPNVVEFIDVGQTEDGLSFYVMEYLDGENLAVTISREGALPTRRACSITIQILLALEAAHQRGVIHRDLKPSNCLRTGEAGDGEHIKLLDFGIAKISTEDAQESNLTRTGSVIGTPNYMSPEQAMSRNIDRRTDIYSAGVILFELLTGQVPFTSSSPMGVLTKHINDAPPSPRQLAPEAEISSELEEIVLKALSKKPDDRFDRAAEFAEALRQVVADARRSELPSGTFRRTERLYGRSKERMVLLEAFAESAAGKRSCVLLTGPAGVGKSAVAVDAVGPRARLTYGKFEQHATDSQFMAMLQIFVQLVERATSSDPETRSQLRQDFENELGNGLRVVAQLIPSIEALVGAQPAPAAVGPAEARNRLQAALLRTLRVFARMERPLVLFLDDLQWANTASLDLIAAAMDDEHLESLLVIATVRGDEVDPASRLGMSLRTLADTSTVRTVRVGALHQPDVAMLVADTLGVEPKQVEELAREVFLRTEGNPLFVHQLLRVAHDDGLLLFDHATMCWRWKLEQLQSELYGDVTALINNQLSRLGAEARQLLSVAACVGTEFPVPLLNAIARVDPANIRDYIEAAIELDLLHRVRPTVGQNEERLRFAHDRIRHAARDQVPSLALPEIHLRIGRELVKNVGNAEPSPLAVAHLCRGRSLIEDLQERQQLAGWSLAAGRRARGAADYDGAWGLLDAGASLVDPTLWQNDHPLAFALHLERAEAAYLTGDFEDAESRYVTLGERSLSPVEHLEVDIQRVVLHLSRGEAPKSLAIGVAALQRSGVDIPMSNEERSEQCEQILEGIQRTLAGRAILSIVDDPPCRDEISRALLRLLAELIAPAHLTETKLADVLICKLVDLSLRRGNAEASAYAYELFAFFLATRNPDRSAHDFGRLGLLINERLGDPNQASRLHFVFGSILHAFEPLDNALEHFSRALDVGLKSGDLVFASYACSHTLIALIGKGAPLTEVRDQARQYLQIMGRTRVASSTAVVKLALRVVACLGGQTDSPTSLGDESFDEDAFVEEIVGAELGFACLWYYVIKLQLCVLEDDLPGAEAALAEADRRLMNSAWFLSTELAFYRCVLLARRAYQLPETERAHQAVQLVEALQPISRWAELCPDNFTHKELLIRAEIAVLRGKVEDASVLFDQAVVRARADGFVATEAIAAERAAAFESARGREGAAGLYAGLAEAAYGKWGTSHRAGSVRARFTNAIPRSGWPQPGSNMSSGTTMSESATADLFGRMLTISRIFAEEEDFDHLTHRLLEQLVRITNTDRGMLVVDRSGSLRVEAVYTIGDDLATRARSTNLPLTDGIDAPVLPLRRVFWTGEMLLVDDIAQNARFANDTYLQRRQPKSILCLPLVAHGRRNGLLYLESRHSYAHFSPGIVDLATIAASQLTVALQAERPTDSGRSSQIVQSDDITRVEG